MADLETPAILKTCIEARVSLARINALGESLPNRSILIHALPLQEARSRSSRWPSCTTSSKPFTLSATGTGAPDAS